MVVEVVWKAFGFEEILASEHNLNKQKILWLKKAGETGFKFDQV